MPKKILVPLESSLLAPAVSPHALDLPNLVTAETSIPPAATQKHPFPLHAPASGILQSFQAKTIKILQPIHAQLQKAGIRASFSITGSALAKTILDVTSEPTPDSNPMCNHGRPGLDRSMGSLNRPTRYE